MNDAINNCWGCGELRHNCICIEKMLDKHDKLYADLTATFDDKKQFKLLNELLDSEREMTLREGE